MTTPPLRDYQAQAVEIAEREPRFAFYFDTGTGKTRTACAIIARDLWLRASGPWLVVTPRSVIPGWLEECARWSIPAWSPSPTMLTRQGLALQGAGDTDKAAWLREMSRRSDAVQVVNPETLLRVADCHCMWGLVVDESAIMQSERAKTTKKLLRIAEKAGRVYLLSGNPSPNGPLQLWGQAMALGLWDRNWWAWASRFGYQDKFRKWHLRRGCSAEIMRLFEARAWYLDKSEVLSLTEETVILRRFVPPDGGLTWQKMLEVIQTEGLNCVMRLRTAASGFIFLAERDDSGKRRHIGTAVGHTARAEALEELLQELAGRRRVLVWHQFDESEKRCREVIEKLGLRCTADPEEFKRCPEIEILLAHPRAIGKGTDGLQHCSADMIFYEISYSYDEYYQALSRLQRSGQTRPVSVYVLLAAGTVDEEAWAAIARKENFVEKLRRALGRSVEQECAACIQ